MSAPTQPQVTAANAALLGSPSRRIVFFAAWVVATGLLFFAPLSRFVGYALSNDNASHAILIPAIFIWILYLERGRIFTTLGSDLHSALFFFIPGCLVSVGYFFFASRLSELNRLSVCIFALILLWVAGFAFIFGRKALQNARFPLAFLLLTIPIPDFLLDKTIYFLQKGTTEIAAVLFDWSGVPVLRDGFVFHLARVNIEVARECSGIRSSLALIILAILVAHFCLRTFWRQAVLVLIGLFVMILKNAIRIVTLTLLASYVDPGFLYGNLHREGGVVFFLIGLALMAPVLWWLERSEGKLPASPAAG
jgi:exosortase